MKRRFYIPLLILIFGITSSFGTLNIKKHYEKNTTHGLLSEEITIERYDTRDLTIETYFACGSFVDLRPNITIKNRFSNIFEDAQGFFQDYFRTNLPEEFTTEELVNNIKSDIHPNIWKEKDIEIIVFNSQLIITAPLPTHKKVDLFLKILKAKSQMKKTH